jgi:hypothetical protein
MACSQSAARQDAGLGVGGHVADGGEEFLVDVLDIGEGRLIC